MKADEAFGPVVAKNVSRYRERAGWTRKDLSKEVGGSHSYIYHVEVSHKMPSLLMGLRIARVLKVSPEKLLEV